MSLISETVNYLHPMKNMDIGQTIILNQFPDMGNVNYQILQNDSKLQLHCSTQMELHHNYVHDLKSIVPVEESTNPSKKESKPRKKVNRVPIDGMLYHSQQLGLKVPPKKQLGIRGRIIHSQAREVINNVFKFMKDEAQNGIKIPIANFRARVLKATGISKCTYVRITSKEFQLGEPQPTTKKKSSDLKVETIASVTENDNIYRPKINRDASTPDGVYNIEDLVETYILDSLAMEAGAIMNSGSADQFGLYPFVTSNINKIVLSSLHEEEKVRSITIFLYIHYLMKFMTTPMKNIKKKFVLCDKSIDVNNHILSVFSENGANGRNRPLHMKDKALCYTMILAAIAMEFEVDVQLLSKDLKVGIKKAVEVARILAFNAKANNKNVVQLKLPLPAPVTYNPKRGRR